MKAEITKLHVLISFTSIQGHSCIRNQNFGVHFLTNLSISLDEIQYVATACWFVGAHAKFIFHKLYSRERTLLT